MDSVNPPSIQPLMFNISVEDAKVAGVDIRSEFEEMMADSIRQEIDAELIERLTLYSKLQRMAEDGCSAGEYIKLIDESSLDNRGMILDHVPDILIPEVEAFYELS